VLAGYEARARMRARGLGRVSSFLENQCPSVDRCLLPCW
jgi:hypothetical protein